MNGLMKVEGFPNSIAKELSYLSDKISQQTIEDFITQDYDSKREQKIFDTSTPADFIKEREGSAGNTFEYHTEEYVLRELNRHYPGWRCAEMDDGYVAELRTTFVKGYLCVKYPTPFGMQTREVWAKGSERIEFTKGTNDASQPEDKDAAARTRWLKLCAKWLGIGLDIYHQRITPELKAQFEQRIIKWHEYGQNAIDIASTMETGAGMRRLIRSLHNEEVTDKFIELLSHIPNDLKLPEKDSLVKDVLWKNFVKLKPTSEENLRNIEKFFAKVKAISEKYNKDATQ